LPGRVGRESLYAGAAFQLRRRLEGAGL
jgi:hypothetical protein